MSISLHHLVKLGVDVGGEVDTHIGSTGITNCGPCSGGQKVRDIGGSPEAAVLSENVTVPAAGQHTLYVDYTVNGPPPLNRLARARVRRYELSFLRRHLGLGRRTRTDHRSKRRRA